MAVTPYLGLASPLASAVAGWIARLKADLNLIDQAFAGLGASGANLLVNPGFEIDQRAAGPYSGHGTITLDRWAIAYVGGVTLTVTRDAAIHDELSQNAAKCVFVLGGGTSGDLEQLVEAWALLKGQTVTLRLRAWCDTPNALRASIQDGTGNSYSAYHPGDGAWHTLVATHALDAAATTLKVAGYLTASCTAYLDNATLALGSTPLAFAPFTNGEDTRRCERYYEVHGGAGGFPYVRGYSAAGAGDLAAVAVAFHAKKGGTPTMTRLGTWSVNNCGQPTVPAANRDGYELQIASLAAGYFDAAPNSADDTITAEWNPA